MSVAYPNTWETGAEILEEADKDDYDERFAT